jgi:Tfp pilus assembly protein PilO
VVRERRGSEAAALHEVESLARELGLHPERRTYRHAEVKGLPLVRVEINMPISGSYTQLVSFLDRLERSSAFLTVDRVELRGKEGAEGEADLSVVLSAYFRAEAAEGHAS